nr:hypothetical protein [Bacteroidota bacterium]
MSNGDGTWSMTFVPADFYGLEAGADVSQICCVFNNGSWDAEGKDFNETGGCIEFFIPLDGVGPTSTTWAITFTPAAFYGIAAGTDVTQIGCVFNNGTWDLEGKDWDPDDPEYCIDFYIELYPPSDETMYADFEDETTGPFTLHVMGCGEWDNELLHPVNETFMIIDNPDPGGINTSSKVMQFNRRGTDDGGQPWGGFWANNDPQFDISLHKYVHVMVWKPKASPVKFKLEGGTSGTLEIESTNQQTATDKWVDMVFDFSTMEGMYPICAFMPDFEDPLTSAGVVEIFFDNIRVNSDPDPMTVNGNIVADFSANITSLCEGDAVTFMPDLLNGFADSLRWDFPGGLPSSSIEQFPEIFYTESGIFDVSLTAFWYNDTNIIVKQNYISVFSIPEVPIKPIGDTLICFNEDFTVYTSNSTSTVWDLSPPNAGNLNTYDSICLIYWNESFTAQASLKVKAINSCGESEYSEVITISKHDAINISLGENILVCYGESKMIEPQISGGTPPYLYFWQPAYLFDNNTSATPLITPNSNAYIYLTITDNMDCSNTINQYVMVEGENYNPDFAAFPYQFISEPFNVQFDNLTPDQEDYDFIWYFGNGDSSLLVQPNYTYPENGLYSVTLIAVSKLTGCSDTLVKEDLIVCTGAGIHDAVPYGFHYFVEEDERELYLVFDNQPDNLCFQLLNIYGNEYYTSIIHQKENKISVKGLDPGMYIFVLRKDDRISTGKIILTR